MTAWVYPTSFSHFCHFPYFVAGFENPISTVGMLSQESQLPAWVFTLSIKLVIDELGLYYLPEGNPFKAYLVALSILHQSPLLLMGVSFSFVLLCSNSIMSFNEPGRIPSLPSLMSKHALIGKSIYRWGGFLLTISRCIPLYSVSN